MKPVQPPESATDSEDRERGCPGHEALREQSSTDQHCHFSHYWQNKVKIDVAGITGRLDLLNIWTGGPIARE